MNAQDQILFGMVVCFILSFQLANHISLKEYDERSNAQWYAQIL